MMKRMVTKGFTLVEILIVVIILGILAAIVIPQFTEASAEARVSNLMTNLQTIRSQLLLYKTQHLEKYPECGDWSNDHFVDEMTTYSDLKGVTKAAADLTANPPVIYGPYLTSIPVNPMNGLNSVTVVTTGTNPKDETSGWWFNAKTGAFKANLKDITVGPDGTVLNEL